MTESSDKPSKPDADPTSGAKDPEDQPTKPAADAPAGRDKEKNSPDDNTARQSEPPPSESTKKTSAKAGEPSAHPHIAARKPARKHGTLSSVLLVLVLLALGAVGFALYRGWEFYQQVEVELQSLQEAREGNARQISQLQSQLQNQLDEHAGNYEQLRQRLVSTSRQTQTHIEDQQSTLARMGERLDGQQKRINTLSTTSREDWLLAEAEYLLRLANQRVLLERSPQNAIALLEAADDILKEVAAGLGDPELFAIREAIGRELTALRLAEDTDKEGIYLELGALADAVETLPRVPSSDLAQAGESDLIELGTDSEQGVVIDKPWLQTFWEGVKSAAGVLDQYIRIEDISEPIKPLVNNAEAQVVALNIRLEIQQAQLALLKGQPEVYDYSLQKVNDLVGKYYLSGEPVKNYQAQINELREVSVAPELPDISGSLKLLNAFIKKLHRLGS